MAACCNRIFLSKQDFYSERQLAVAIAEHDPVAFQQLFASYYPQLYPQVKKITQSDPVTEDLLQETFLKVWINRDKLPEIENLRAWILRIAYYQAFTYLRRQSLHERKVSQLTTSEGIKPGTQTEDLLSFRELKQAVGEAIRKLPPQQKKVYLLSREQGLKNREIAEVLNLSEQSVKNTLVRALKLIREEVERAGHVIFSVLLLISCYFQQ